MPRQLLWIYIALLILMGGRVVSAQVDIPTPAPVIPAIHIDSVTYDENRNAFRARLLYDNPTMIHGLNIKVQNRRTGILIQELNYGTLLPDFDINAEDLVPGESYILTVTAQDYMGQILRLSVPQNYGGETVQTIQSTLNFEYEQSKEPIINFSSVAYISENLSYLVRLDQTNTQHISNYRLWMQANTGLKATEDFLFTGPLPDPLSIPVGEIESGQYVIVIEAMDAQGKVLTRAQSDTLNYVKPVCDLVCIMGNNMAFTVIVALVVGVLIILLAYSFLRRQPKEYDSIPIIRPSKGALIDDDELSNYTRDSKNALKNAPKLSLLLHDGLAPGPNNQRVLVDSIPFSIGSNYTNNLVLDHPEVSGRHASILFKRGSYYLIDEQSTNGTKLNGQRLKPKEQMNLQNGNIITFSKVSYHIEVM
jgi:hypothetical protein